MSDKRIVVWVQRFADRPYFMLQWHDPDTGKRKSKSAETNNPVDAETKRSDLEYELNHGKYQEASRMTWERFRELFEEEYVTGTRPATRRNFIDTLNLFERLCRPRLLRSIDERAISSFVAAMRREPGRAKESPGMAASSIKVRLQFLHTALSWAVRQKMLPSVPGFPTIKPPKKDPQPVAPELFERLLLKAKGDEQMQAYLLCGWLAGLRLTEAFALEWEETTAAPYLDLNRNRIILPAEIVKAGDDQWLPLDPELQAVLEKLPRQGRQVFRFVTKGGRPLQAGGVSQRVIDLAAKAGVKLTMKSLRRGFGCRYAGKVSAHVLQKLMRHANIKTTLDYYANLDDAVEEAVLGSKRNTSRNSQPFQPCEQPRVD